MGGRARKGKGKGGEGGRGKGREGEGKREGRGREGPPTAFWTNRTLLLSNPRHNTNLNPFLSLT